jgi:hypothetical protein
MTRLAALFVVRCGKVWRSTPAHSRGENGRYVFRIVASSPHDQPMVIAFEGQGSGHGAIGARPIQPGELSSQSISGSILQKHAKWLHARLSNQFAVGAPAADIDETADSREDLAESIGPLPLRITDDPAERGIAGLSSGGIYAFTVKPICGPREAPP